MIIAMAGLPAAGKSVIAKGLAKASGALILDKDEIRASLLGPEDIQYSREQDDFIMDIIFRLMKHLLLMDPDRSIIIDGRPFSRRYQREYLYKAAEESKTVLKVIECICSEESARNRLDKALRSNEHLAGNRNLELYRSMKDNWEEIKKPHLVVDTDNNNEDDCIKMASEFIGAT